MAGSDPLSFAYNGDGLRQTRTDTTTNITTSFVWDVSGRTPVVLDDGTQYVYGANGLVEQVVNGTPSYYLSDGLGSTLAVCDGSGTVQQTYSYDVYGQATAGVNNHPTEYGFAGQQADPTELQYLRARYYDPTTGRFLSRDPLSAGDPTGHHPYGYATNNPANASDPSGLTIYNVYASGPCPCAWVGTQDSDTGQLYDAAGQPVDTLPGANLTPYQYFESVLAQYGGKPGDRVVEGQGGLAEAEAEFNKILADAPLYSGVIVDMGAPGGYARGGWLVHIVTQGGLDMYVGLRVVTSSGPAGESPSIDVNASAAGLPYFQIHFPQGPMTQPEIDTAVLRVGVGVLTAMGVPAVLIPYLLGQLGCCGPNPEPMPDGSP